MSYSSKGDLQFCREILPAVSRTFAANIKVLTGSVYRAVLCGYLICRIIDTVEDAPGLKPFKKISFLKSFLILFKKASIDEKKTADWVDSVNHIQSTEAEKVLLQETARVLRVYYSLPDSLKEGMRQPIITMAEGMSRVIRKYAGKKDVSLADENELKKYCYYVAGTVGELLTAVFAHRIKDPAIVRHLRLFMVDFGLALQMTNIIKDFRDDKKRGWGYIPASWFKRVKVSRKDFYSARYPAKNSEILRDFILMIKDYQQKSLIYLITIPWYYLRLRLFCAIPLFISVMTLALISTQTANKKIQHKIKRKQVKKLLISLPFIVWSDRLLTVYFKKISAVITF